MKILENDGLKEEFNQVDIHAFSMDNYYEVYGEDITEAELVTASQTNGEYHYSGFLPYNNDIYVSLYIPYHCKDFTVVRWKTIVEEEVCNDEKFIILHNERDINNAMIHMGFKLMSHTLFWFNQERLEGKFGG